MPKNKQALRRQRVRRRIRGKISGTAERPRLSVYRSNTAIYAQLIDDASGTTLASASSKGSEAVPVDSGKQVGETLAERAKEAGVTRVVFDRNGYRYHGRVKAVAEGARSGGLQF